MNDTRRFVMNRDGYYFELWGTAMAEINQSYMASRGCEFYMTELELHKRVCEKLGLMMDEVGGNTITVKVEDGSVLECDGRGMWTKVDMDIKYIDTFVSEYEL